MRQKDEFWDKKVFISPELMDLILQQALRLHDHCSLETATHSSSLCLIYCPEI